MRSFAYDWGQRKCCPLSLSDRCCRLPVESARANERSVSAEVRVALREHLARTEKEGAGVRTLERELQDAAAHSGPRPAGKGWRRAGRFWERPKPADAEVIESVAADDGVAYFEARPWARRGSRPRGRGAPTEDAGRYEHVRPRA